MMSGFSSYFIFVLSFCLILLFDRVLFPLLNWLWFLVVQLSDLLTLKKIPSRFYGLNRFFEKIWFINSTGDTIDVSHRLVSKYFWRKPENKQTNKSSSSYWCPNMPMANLIFPIHVRNGARTCKKVHLPCNFNFSQRWRSPTGCPRIHAKMQPFSKRNIQTKIPCTGTLLCALVFKSVRCFKNENGVISK